MDLIRELNYMCNADIFRIAFSMKTTRPNREDHNKVRLWLEKILKSNKTLSDLKLRNEFLHCLSQNVESGKLTAPFNQDPPRAGLKAIARHFLNRSEAPTQDDEAMAMLRFLPAKHGGFLLPKPLPQIGAYCYIAASGPDECSKKCVVE